MKTVGPPPRPSAVWEQRVGVERRLLDLTAGLGRFGAEMARNDYANAPFGGCLEGAVASGVNRIYGYGFGNWEKKLLGGRRPWAPHARFREFGAPCLWEREKAFRRCGNQELVSGA